MMVLPIAVNYHGKKAFITLALGATAKNCHSVNKAGGFIKNRRLLDTIGR